MDTTSPKNRKGRLIHCAGVESLESTPFGKRPFQSFFSWISLWNRLNACRYWFNHLL
jgi:hypothetical protein